MMKKFFVKLIIVLMVLMLLPVGDALCGKKKKHSSSNAWRSPESRMISKAVGERWWVFGRIKGNHNVITVVLEPLRSSDPLLDTSTNKFGYYAFSDVGQGNPSNYKLVIYSGDTEVKRVSLKGIRKGKRVPDIKLW